MCSTNKSSGQFINWSPKPSERPNKTIFNSEAGIWLCVFCMNIWKRFLNAALVFSELTIAFPLFAFLLISNFCTYHPFRKYLLRLFFFGIISALILYFIRDNPKNILFTFLWAIIYLQACEYVCSHTKSLIWQFYWLGLLFFIMGPLIVASDYSLFGFFFLMALYARQRAPTYLNDLAVFATGITMNCYNIPAIISTFSILFCLMFVFHISAGRRLVKWWVFYVYFPLHLLILWMLRSLI